MSARRRAPRGPPGHPRTPEEVADTARARASREPVVYVARPVSPFLRRVLHLVDDPEYRAELRRQRLEALQLRHVT